MLYKNIAIFSVSAFILFFSINNVFAQEGVGIKVSPAMIEDNVDPGEVYDFSIKVTNKNTSKQTFYITKQNIKGVSPGGLPIFAGEEEVTPYELSSWIKMPQDSVVIGADQAEKISFSVEVPAGASPGAHFGGVFFDLRPPKLREIGSGVGYKVGTIISLRISGDITEEARIREFTSGKSIFSIPRVDFKTKVENLGNVLVRPHGAIEITNMLGKQVARIRVNDQGATVFPKAEKSFDARWDYDGFTIGRYQALLALVYGEEGRKTISATLSFWVLPLKLIGIALGTIIGLVSAVFILIRYYIKRRLRQMGVMANGLAKKIKNIDSDVYYRHYNQNRSSKLVFIFVALLLFAVIFLIVLFFLFA